MLICWRWNTLEPENFCIGKQLCRRICFSCKVPSKRRDDAALPEKPCYANRLWLPHGDVTSAILPYLPRFGVCCTCAEYPARNIAARSALTKRSSAWPAAIGGLNHWRALKWPVQLRYRFSTENTVFLV